MHDVRTEPPQQGDRVRAGPRGDGECRPELVEVGTLPVVGALVDEQGLDPCPFQSSNLLLDDVVLAAWLP